MVPAGQNILTVIVLHEFYLITFFRVNPRADHICTSFSVLSFYLEVSFLINKGFLIISFLVRLSMFETVSF